MEIKKKYKLTDECIIQDGHTLYRIEAVTDFGNVRAGDKGGWVESYINLSFDGLAWVYDNAKVYGKARVYDNAKVYGDAMAAASVYGTAIVCGFAKVYDDAKVFANASVQGEANVYGMAKVFGNAMVYGKAEVAGRAIVSDETEITGNAIVLNIHDYILFKNWWGSGRFFTWTRSNNMWRVGCFYGTGEALIARAYKDSMLSGQEYERVVNYVKSILEDTSDRKGQENGER